MAAAARAACAIPTPEIPGKQAYRDKRQCQADQDRLNDITGEMERRHSVDGQVLRSADEFKSAWLFSISQSGREIGGSHDDSLLRRLWRLDANILRLPLAVEPHGVPAAPGGGQMLKCLLVTHFHDGRLAVDFVERGQD